MSETTQIWYFLRMRIRDFQIEFLPGKDTNDKINLINDFFLTTNLFTHTGIKNGTMRPKVYLSYLKSR